jgi:hypothetical protein
MAYCNEEIAVGDLILAEVLQGWNAKRFDEAGWYLVQTSVWLPLTYVRGSATASETRS